jgi:hypothetical protein
MNAKLKYSLLLLVGLCVTPFISYADYAMNLAFNNLTNDAFTMTPGQSSCMVNFSNAPLPIYSSNQQTPTYYNTADTDQDHACADNPSWYNITLSNNTDPTIPSTVIQCESDDHTFNWCHVISGPQKTPTYEITITAQTQYLMQLNIFFPLMNTAHR